MRDGGKLPFWWAILDAAEAWGGPAWIVANEEPTNEGRLRWFQRFLVWNEQRQIAKKMAVKDFLGI